MKLPSCHDLFKWLCSSSCVDADSVFNFCARPPCCTTERSLEDVRMTLNGNGKQFFCTVFRQYASTARVHDAHPRDTDHDLSLPSEGQELSQAFFGVIKF